MTWKKTKDDGDMIIFKKDKSEIRIDGDYRGWLVSIEPSNKKPIFKNHRTKEKALKFAKSYMKKH